MKEDKTPSVVDVQHQIRANASQLQDYFSDLYAWEKSIGKEDSARKRAAKTAKNPASTGATPPPRAARGVGVGSNNEAADGINGKKPAAHTYDRGYNRWEKFDVDAALREADEDASAKTKSGAASPPLQSSPGPRRVVAASPATKSREELEKEEGNAHYKRGDYVAAIKSYTRCLGYNPQNAVVLSNRAMAYLKNREFANAEDDCTLALKADPAHVKSYSRRGTARNSLGKHRLALLDFQQAVTLDPKSRQIQTQLQSTRELIRTAIKRAPKRTEFAIEVIGESPPSKQRGSEQDNEEGTENKENLGSLQQATLSSATAAPTQKPPLHEADPAELPPAPSSTQTPAQTGAKTTKKSSVILPKLPKKAPATSYEFGRVWKSLALRGDSDRLISLRADYLRMIDPSAVRAIFKTAIESDVLCEILHVFRHAVLSSSDSGATVPEGSTSFVLAFASELTKVPRFHMTVMLLSDKEKEDMTWVVSSLEEQVQDGDESKKRQVADLKKLYEL